MKSTLDAKEFRSALEKVMKVPVRSCNLILEQVMAEFTPHGCTLTTTNLEQRAMVPLSAVGDTFSLVFSDSKAVLKACKYFSGSLTLDYLKDEITLSSAGKTLRQTGLKVSEFPDSWVIGKKNNKYITNAAVLWDRYKHVGYAAARPEAKRGIYEGICFTDCRIAALNGYRLAVNSDESLRVKWPFVLPPKAFELLPIFNGADIQITEDACYAELSGGGVTVQTRMLNGVFLNIDGAIPSDFKEEYTVLCKEFAASLRYFNDLIKGGPISPVKFAAGQLSVSHNGSEYSADVEIDGQASIIYGFNCRYMLEGLEQVKNADWVNIRVSGPASPIVLTDGQNNLSMVLPCKLPDAA